MSDPIYFIHITDTHLKASAEQNFLKLDTTSKLRAVLAQIAALSLKVSFVVISGDLAHEGTVEDYRYIRTLLDEESAKLGVPILVALGNHDHRAPFREGYLNQTGDDPYYYVHMAGDLRVIVLDSQIPGGEVAGEISAAQLDWLDDQLADEAPAGTVVVLHHPPHSNSFPLLDNHMLRNPHDLADMIADSDVLALFSGHIHFNSIGALDGVLSAAGEGVAFGIDGTETRAYRMVDSMGYNLVMVQNGQVSIQPTTMPGERKQLVYMTLEQLAEWMRQNEAAHA